MANVTDPLIAQISGSDPQNLLEYITRQKIYDSRFWKEECFGLSVTNVLEKIVASVQCLGGLPSPTLALVLKLLQLHPDHDLIATAFVQQTEFKYLRAVGCLYIRLTSRPVEIYNTLELLYVDNRKLRVYNSRHQPQQQWSITTMDQFIHSLLSSSTNNNSNSDFGLGIALPRLPARRVLQDAGYLPAGSRPSALQPIFLQDYTAGTCNSGKDSTCAVAANMHSPMHQYLEHKALVEKSPAAVALWNQRQRHQQQPMTGDNGSIIHNPPPTTTTTIRDSATSHQQQELPQHTVFGMDERERAPKKKKKHERNYDNLFKKQPNPPSNHNNNNNATATTTTDDSAKFTSQTAPEDDPASEDYWNEQRAKLGLSKLK